MLSIDECKAHLVNYNLSDKEIENVRELLYSFVERTLDYCVETGMFVVANESCDQNEHKEALKQRAP